MGPTEIIAIIAGLSGLLTALGILLRTRASLAGQAQKITSTVYQQLVSELQEERADLRKRIDNLKDEIDDLRERWQQEMERATALQLRVRELESRNKELEEEVRKLKAQNTELLKCMSKS